MITKTEKITLENIGNGAPAEIFRREWKRIVNNLFDPSTDLKTKRKLAIIIEAVPHESRQAAAIKIYHKTDLAGLQPLEISIVMGEDENGIESREVVPAQQSLFGEERGFEAKDISSLN